MAGGSASVMSSGDDMVIAVSGEILGCDSKLENGEGRRDTIRKWKTRSIRRDAFSGFEGSGT